MGYLEEPIMECYSLMNRQNFQDLCLNANCSIYKLQTACTVNLFFLSPQQQLYKKCTGCKRSVPFSSQTFVLNIFQSKTPWTTLKEEVTSSYEMLVHIYLCQSTLHHILKDKSSSAPPLLRTPNLIMVWSFRNMTFQTVHTSLHHNTSYVAVIIKFHYNNPHNFWATTLHCTTILRSTSSQYILPVTPMLRLAVEPKLPAGVLCPPKLAKGDPVGQLFATGPVIWA